MIILESVLQKIFTECPAVPPETGGLLGGQGEIITYAVFDKNIPVTTRAEYMPNIAFLNQILTEWAKNGISFLGMFHSHPCLEKELSEPDKSCISKIIQSVPENQMLWFPIINPQQKEIYSYATYCKDGRLFIEKDVVICRKAV